MFDPIHSPTESNDTLFDAGTGDADPGSAAPLPDAGTLLAAAGLPAHAIRRFSAPGHMPVRTAEQSEREAWRMVKGEGSREA